FCAFSFRRHEEVENHRSSRFALCERVRVLVPATDENDFPGPGPLQTAGRAAEGEQLEVVADRSTDGVGRSGAHRHALQVLYPRDRQSGRIAVGYIYSA